MSELRPACFQGLFFVASVGCMQFLNLFSEFFFPPRHYWHRHDVTELYVFVKSVILNFILIFIVENCSWIFTVPSLGNVWLLWKKKVFSHGYIYTDIFTIYKLLSKFWIFRLVSFVSVKSDWASVADYRYFAWLESIADIQQDYENIHFAAKVDTIVLRPSYEHTLAQAFLNWKCSTLTQSSWAALPSLISSGPLLTSTLHPHNWRSPQSGFSMVCLSVCVFHERTHT